ncbi:hypothetical protein [Kribbella sp. NPDC004536]|uniref:hypothetical protein n=1 Tax=Kribbella sp. NPDC004536 TaxID=3364106 RepID=UPI0036A50410
MKRWGAGIALMGTAGLLVSAALPAEASVDGATKYAAVSTASPVFVKRYFNCYYDEGCFATAVLPRTWRAVRLGTDEYRFADRSAPRMIRIRMNLTGPSPAAAAKHKQAALKGTRGLKILSRKSATNTHAQQGPLTMTTLVYTYRSGSTTRWVATRYVAQWGMTTANIELTVGGRLQDRVLLTKVLDKATTSIALAG